MTRMMRNAISVIPDGTYSFSDVVEAVVRRICERSAPIARACSEPPGNSVTMIARITLEATAPPTPCKKRAAISIVWLVAAPHRMEAAVNSTPIRVGLVDWEDIV